MKEIDVVITWVDGADTEWSNLKNSFLPDEERVKANASANRFRDWDNLQYFFRGIEKFMPWVRKVHFVTFGHLPKWLNVNHPKLNIVNHEDFIPEQYRPTFNSNCIELNLHRIPGLAENFINFNDDMFVIKKTRPDDFFLNGLPRDTAALSPQPIHRNTITSVELNNMKIINHYFTVNDVLKEKKKWFNIKLYRQLALRTLIFSRFSTILGVFQSHIPFSYNKSTFETIWEKETSTLNNSCLHKFRNPEDVSEWLMRSWQLLSGKFEPRSRNFGLLVSASDIETVKKVLDVKSIYKVACINDDELVEDFEKTKKLVNAELNRILPEKSKFEL